MGKFAFRSGKERPTRVKLSEYPNDMVYDFSKDVRQGYGETVRVSPDKLRATVPTVSPSPKYKRREFLEGIKGPVGVRTPDGNVPFS